MDPEQIRAEMTETRARIDEKLDVLEARMSGARDQTVRAAGVALAVTAVLLVVTWLRRRRPPAW
jgi:hypothetical protein